jgi:hypothetical protein
MMNSPWISLFALAAFLLAIALGMFVRGKIRDRHLTAETSAVMHATVAMLITFSALVVGLLMSSSKDSFSRADGTMRNYTGTLVSLNDALHAAGPEGVAIQKSLAVYTAAVIASTWTAQPPPAGDFYPRNLGQTSGSALPDNPAIGDLLTAVGEQIDDLPAATRAQRLTQQRCQALVARIVEQRINLVAASQVSLSKPFFVVLVFWLFVAFLSLGLSAPVNALTITVTTLGAAALASALYVIVDLSTLYDNGIFSISSVPMRTALARMPQP